MFTLDVTGPIPSSLTLSALSCPLLLLRIVTTSEQKKRKAATLFALHYLQDKTERQGISTRSAQRTSKNDATGNFFLVTRTLRAPPLYSRLGVMVFELRQEPLQIFGVKTINSGLERESALRLGGLFGQPPISTIKM
ncbi:hypothetical protein EGR_02735 [Echinococcus granulosus]|uniref:Uncharacterized protein n=1 Tax=Echinococcus granulosus TaxID=6210 RepID=W6UV69_ECHGR|nr:hypothetical protein EGR_02735 [Echinococcus granulosus]EUB62282.1 hypothetical protein EGR_02735 [Echinococcus granulosus]